MRVSGGASSIQGAWFRWRNRLGAIALSFLTTVILATPTQAATRIRLQYGPLSRSIRLSDLETFAETGRLEGSLKLLRSRLSPEMQDQVRTVLQAHYEVDPVMVNRFSYTQSGRLLLTEMGELVQTETRQNGFYALRAALTLAASDPEGLSLLNFLRQFPTDIHIDVVRVLAIAQDFSDLLAETQGAIAQLTDQMNELAASEPPIDFRQLPDPRRPGPSAVSMQTLELYDEARDRGFAVDVYLPQQEAVSELLPVIVVSNGLGARRSRFDELAVHLASYGFAVAMLDHPGSDRQRLLEFEQGLHPENFDAEEYVDRPLDVSFLLDELERLNAEQFGDRLDPSRAGIFGYSFGGTTALALVGAEVDRAHLAEDCATRSGLLNISLLYQCRALELPPELPPLADERIQAIYVFVPFGRSLYGPEGMAQVEGPVFWEMTDQDILTPLAIEQLPPFAWLTAGQTSGDRYLVATEGLPHARLTLDVLNRLTGQAIAWEDIKPIAETYHQMLSLAFFQVYLADNAAYRPYLSARGMQHLEDAAYPLRWARSLDGLIPPASPENGVIPAPPD